MTSTPQIGTPAPTSTESGPEPTEAPEARVEQMRGLLRAALDAGGDDATTLVRALLKYEKTCTHAPGSRRSHHNWKGGWVRHTLEVYHVACRLADEVFVVGSPSTPEEYRGVPRREIERRLFLAALLHDIEKPFVYAQDEGATVEERARIEAARALRTKAQRLSFRFMFAAEEGIKLTADVENAIRYAEGENDDYRPGERVMGPLAALVHAADVVSARATYGFEPGGLRIPRKEPANARSEPAKAGPEAISQPRPAAPRARTVRIWLDDIREVPEGWQAARTASEAIEMLIRGNVDEISLDHDLGPPEAGTGYEVLVWIENRTRAHAEYLPPLVRIHTANPAARRRMEPGAEWLEKTLYERLTAQSAAKPAKKTPAAETVAGPAA